MFNIEPIDFNVLKENVSIYPKNFSREKIDYFIVTVNKPDRSYTGILCSISVADKHIFKKHESISIERKDNVKNYLRQGGIQKRPILMTYKDSKVINELQKKVTVKKPCYEISFNDELFSLWKVSNELSRKELAQELLLSGGIYIADGHHRWAAISEGITINELDDTKKIFCHLVPASQLKIYAYHRILKGELPLSVVFQVLRDKFNVLKCESCIKPILHDQFGMFINGNWYKISAKPNGTFDSHLNPEILNNEIIEKLASYNPNIDIHYFCDNCSMLEFEENILSATNNIGFTTMPISIENLITISDNMKVLPKKSTWIEPKLPEGLFNYHF